MQTSSAQTTNTSGETMQQKKEARDALRAVSVTDGFWSRLIERNRTATLPHVFSQCEEAGQIRNLEIAAGRISADYTGGSSVDSNVYKVLEGASYCLSLLPDPELDTYLDTLIELIASAQQPDGYLNSYFTLQAPSERYADLHRSHELYCAGHLFEAAVAHYEATGKPTLLDVAIRLADHIDATFGPGKYETVPGHQEIELALVRLFKVTGTRRFMELARYFVDLRGNEAMVAREYAGKPVIESERHPGRNRPPEYRQDHMPLIKQREPVGHGVRAGYLYAGLTDVAIEYGSQEHAAAADALWNSIVAKHLYLTGGIGTHQHRDEGFGDDYLLPNDTAYCETCAGIALLLFTHRMDLLKGHSKYADVIELILYNHLLASTDHSGCNVAYRNPLASDGTAIRPPWNNPACCPTNVVRIIPQIPRLIYATGVNALYVDQFINSAAKLTVDGQRVDVAQESEYPWDGQITITVEPETPQTFDLFIRIPGWVDGRPVPSDLYGVPDHRGSGPTVTVNGEEWDSAARTRGYCCVSRTWRPGDRIVVDLPMPVQRVTAHKKVEANRGRVALMRGPVLYCVEAADHELDVDEITLGVTAELETEHGEGLFDGVVVIRDATGPLTAIPYYLWNNRQPGKMAVWIPQAT